MLLAFAPMAFFFSAVYTESLFLALSAWCLYQARRFEESADEARRLLQSEPRYGSARFVLGWNLRRAGAFEEAVERQRQAMEYI